MRPTARESNSSRYYSGTDEHRLYLATRSSHILFFNRHLVTQVHRQRQLGGNRLARLVRGRAEPADVAGTGIALRVPRYDAISQMRQQRAMIPVPSAAGPHPFTPAPMPVLLTVS